MAVFALGISFSSSWAKFVVRYSLFTLFFNVWWRKLPELEKLAHQVSFPDSTHIPLSLLYTSFFSWTESEVLPSLDLDLDLDSWIIIPRRKCEKVEEHWIDIYIPLFQLLPLGHRWSWIWSWTWTWIWIPG